MKVLKIGTKRHLEWSDTVKSLLGIEVEGTVCNVVKRDSLTWVDLIGSNGDRRIFTCEVREVPYTPLVKRSAKRAIHDGANEGRES